MKRNTKKTIKIVAIVLMIAFLTYFIVGVSNNNFKFPLAVGGTSGFLTLGLSPVQFSSNDPSLNGQAWILTVSQNGGSENAEGQFNLVDGQTSSDSFKIETILDKNYLLYPIQNQNIPISKVSFVKTTYNPLGQLYGCNTDYWDNAYKESGLPGFATVWCYKFTPDAYYGSIGTGNVNFQTTISVTGTGGSDSCVVSNYQSPTCYSNGGNIIASYGGSLVNGNNIPNAANDKKYAFYLPTSGGWRIGSQTAYNNFRTYTQSGLTSCFSLPPNGNIDNCFTQYNALESQAITQVSWGIVGGQNAFTMGTQDKAQIQMDLPYPTQYPVLSMKIKALLVGIHVSVGQPKIISEDSACFQTGQQGTVAVTVKNVGTAKGSFDVSLQCSGQFNQVGGAQRISNVTPNDQKTIYVPLTANVPSGTSKESCTITATDSANPNNKDTATVGVCAGSIPVCTAGDQRPIGKQIQECKNNGWVTIQTCAENETPDYVNGKLQCVQGNNGSSGGFFDSIGNFFSNIWDGITGFFMGVFDFIKLLTILAGVLAGFLSLFFTKDVMDSFKSVKKIQWLVWTVSIIVGVLVFMIVFQYWWILLIIGVLYFVFKILKKIYLP